MCWKKHWLYICKICIYEENGVKLLKAKNKIVSLYIWCQFFLSIYYSSYIFSCLRLWSVFRSYLCFLLFLPLYNIFRFVFVNTVTIHARHFFKYILYTRYWMPRLMLLKSLNASLMGILWEWCAQVILGLRHTKLITWV